jgi:hypothetical protein
MRRWRVRLADPPPAAHPLVFVAAVFADLVMGSGSLVASVFMTERPERWEPVPLDYGEFLGVQLEARLADRGPHSPYPFPRVASTATLMTLLRRHANDRGDRPPSLRRHRTADHRPWPWTRFMAVLRVA